MQDREEKHTEDEEEDEDKTEEEQLKDAYKKAKKARDMATAVCADFEDCLAKANPYLSKASKQKWLEGPAALGCHGQQTEGSCQQRKCTP